MRGHPLARAANSVYLGNQVASQKSLGAKNPRKRGTKRVNGREKKKEERVRRKESGRSWKRVVKNRRNQKKC